MTSGGTVGADSLATRPSWGKRLVGIEGLRGLAALSVLLHHTGRHLSSEDALGAAGYRASELAAHGLTLFFVLSGFLLYRPFIAALILNKPAPRIANYFRNRALRVYPAYVVIFLFVTLVMGSAYVASPAVALDDQIVGRVTDPLTFVLDLLLLQTYVPSTILTGLGVAWSLTAEIAFYVLLPGLALAAGFFARRRVRPAVAATVPAALMIAVGLTVTTVLSLAKRGLTAEELAQFSWGPTWTAVLERSVVAQADLFGYGMLAAVAVVVLQSRGLRSTRLSFRIALVASAVLLALLAVTEGRWLTTSAFGVAAATVLFATVLPGSKAHSPNYLATALEWRPLRYVGLISYSIYLWHVPVIWWLRERRLYDDSTLGGAALSLLVVLLATTALASITYYLVERPAMNLKRRTDRISEPPPSSGSPARSASDQR